MKRYPSKNCIRLMAEVEGLTGGLCEWGISGTEDLILHLVIGKTGYANAVELDKADAADIDAAKRRLLVLARRELLHAESA